jgi:3-oxoacyl-[acyl-carrier-protein] synthase-3
MVAVKIVSCGSYLPEKCLTNSDLAEKLETSDEWIVQRTGIKKRYIASPNQSTSDLALAASLDCITKSQQVIKNIDGLIVATTTPDMNFPSTACILQSKLEKHGIKVNFAFDIQAVCSGFLYAITQANAMIKSGLANSILVIGAETLSRILDWTDRSSCILFGDGAGAMLLQTCEDEGQLSDILYTKIYSDGSLKDILYANPTIKMEGREVFKHAVTKMSDSLLEGLDRLGLNLDDLDFVIAHQANERILDYIADKLEIQSDKFIKTVGLHANTSAASIPLAFNWALNQAKLVKRGQNIAFTALGAGLTWGSAVIKF